MLTQKMKQPFKTAQPVLFPPLADRAAWESLPGAARWAAAGQAALADAQTAPELPLSLWLQFTRSGDRAKWEHAYFAALPLLHEGEPVAFYHESPNTQLDHRAQVVGQVQQYIRDHLSERLTLNDVAAVFNFSPNYLSQLFAQNSESGFVEFVTATRITAAKELMASTDLKVYEISDKVGFDSAFYFSKVFKKLEGVSPREYMQRMKVSYVDAKDEATV